MLYNFNKYIISKNSGNILSRQLLSHPIYIYIYIYILGVVKRNPLFFHSISCKNNGFLFTTPNTYVYIRLTRKKNYFF